MLPVLWLVLTWLAPNLAVPLLTAGALASLALRSSGGVSERVEIAVESFAQVRTSTLTITAGRATPSVYLDLAGWQIDAGPEGIVLAHARDTTRYHRVSDAPFTSPSDLESAAPPLPTPHLDLAFADPASGAQQSVRWTPWPDHLRWVSASLADDDPQAIVLVGRGATTRATMRIVIGRITRFEGERVDPDAPITIRWSAVLTPPRRALDLTERREAPRARLAPYPGSLSVGDIMPDLILRLSTGEDAELSAWLAGARTPLFLAIVGVPEHAARAGEAFAAGVQDARTRLTIEATLDGRTVPRFSAMLVLVVAPDATPPVHAPEPVVAATTTEPRLGERLDAAAPCIVAVLDGERRILELTPVPPNDHGVPDAAALRATAERIVLTRLREKTP